MSQNEIHRPSLYVNAVLWLLLIIPVHISDKQWGVTHKNYNYCGDTCLGIVQLIRWCVSYTGQLTARLTHKCSCAFSWRRMPRTSTPSGSWSKSNSITCKKFAQNVTVNKPVSWSSWQSFSHSISSQPFMIPQHVLLHLKLSILCTEFMKKYTLLYGLPCSQAIRTYATFKAFTVM
jgi:hypothetical protein